MITRPAVAVMGAGRIGRAIAFLLSHCGDYDVHLFDSASGPLSLLPAAPDIHPQLLEQSNPPALRAALQDKVAVVSACPFSQNRAIAEAALQAGCHYFDLTEDVSTTEQIRQVAGEARSGQCFLPQCGLAPGFISVLGQAVARRFERLQSLTLRVGALPLFPSNQMLYNLTWSTEGLINEYCNPCEAIVRGDYVRVAALEGLETFTLDGISYEAFNTSGGLGSLCDTLQGQVQELGYKTIRYPGHRQLMAFLINDLQLGRVEHRPLLKQIIEEAVAVTWQDLVLIMASGTGFIDGQLCQHTEVFKLYHQQLHGQHWSAIQLSTASALCAMVDLCLQQQLSGDGFVKQESISLEDFLANRFAEPYLEGRHT